MIRKNRYNIYSGLKFVNLTIEYTCKDRSASIRSYQKITQRIELWQTKKQK